MEQLRTPTSHQRAAAERSRALAAVSVGVIAIGALLLLQRRRGRAPSASGDTRSVHVHEAITINRPAAEIYQQWRRFERFPTFVSHLVKSVGDRENEWIAWRSIEGSDVEHSGVEHSGTARFEPAPGGRGTEVHVELQYRPRAGTLGRAVAHLMGNDPEQRIREDLRRFKQFLETGEIPISDGPGLWRPAQPPARTEELDAYLGGRR